MYLSHKEGASRRYMVVGHGARETAMAQRLLMEGHTVFSYSMHPNHGLASICRDVRYADTYDAKMITAYSHECGADTIVPGHELAIYDGLADLGNSLGIRVFAPRQSVSRLESDKLFARSICHKVNPDFCVGTKCFFSAADLLAEIMSRTEPAVLKIWDEAKKSYSIHVIGDNGSELSLDELVLNKIRAFSGAVGEKAPFLLEEFSDGKDLCVYAAIDGRNVYLSDPMHDSCFLEEGNKGAKTGGMGCVSNGRLLPFMDDADMQAVEDFIRAYIEEASAILGYIKGLFSFQFIKTPNGLKFNEIDVRPGDPEMVNYLSLLISRFDTFIDGVCDGDLPRPEFSGQASLSMYSVTPGYPVAPEETRYFLADEEGEKANGGKLYFGNSRRVEHTGEFISRGRAFLIAATGENIAECRKRILGTADHIQAAGHEQDVRCQTLRRRTDIGLCF